MKKSFVIVIVLALASVGALYSLPKGVVVDEKRKGEMAAQTTPAAGGHATPEESKSTTSTKGHVEALPPGEQQRLDALVGEFAQKTGAEKIAAADSLIAKLSKLNRFDSAAYYAGEVARIAPSLSRWLSAGDRYYQAFTFAVEEAKSARMGEKTREFYSKALEKNPNLLTAKTNMAMTYIATSNPMQGITMLRQVLEQDPDNVEALFNLGLLAIRSNQYDKAAERFEHILRDHPDNLRAQFYLGISYAELGRKEEARKWLESVKKIEKDPTVQAGVDEYLKKL